MTRRTVCAAALLGLVSLGAAGSASAQCAEPEEAPVLVLETVFLLVGGVSFPLPEKECAKIVKTAVAACHGAVASAVACNDALFRSVTKARRTGCGVLDKSAQADCEAALAGYLEGLSVVIAAEALAADQVCDGAFEGELAATCRDGLP